MKDHKIIWIYWDQGWSNTPEIVQTCRASWEQLNPEYKVIPLDKDSLTQYVSLPSSHTKNTNLSIALKSDIIRLNLLKKYGGIWVDATLICTKPLHSWLSEFYSSGFFAFRNPGKDRLCSSWFIAAEPDNKLLTLLHSELTSFVYSTNFTNQHNKKGFLYRLFYKLKWNRKISTTVNWLSDCVQKKIKTYPYYIFHYTFNKVIIENNECREIWESSKPFESKLPHKLQKLSKKESNLNQAKQLLISKQSPVYKLNWRKDINTPFWKETLKTLLEINTELLNTNIDK